MTGVGVLSSLGEGLEAHWAALERGRDGHRPHQGLGEVHPVPGHAALLTEPMRSELARAWPDLQPLDAMACQVARSALTAAGRDGDGLAVLVGTSNGGLHARRDLTRCRRDHRASLIGQAGTDGTARIVAARLGCSGPRATVSTACASSTHAVGLATTWLRQGRIEAALVIGADVVLDMVAAGFDALGVLGREPCAPFSKPVGMSLGEGAAAWVLERSDAARARGARVHGHVLGWGSSADAFHATAPDPRGLGMAASIRAALADAGVGPDEIDLYSAQGTGTEANDAAETLAVLGALGGEVPVTSGKGHLGHSQGAGGLLEASLALEGIARQALPPLARFRGPRALAPSRLVHGPPEAASVDVVVKHSSAFGGANATLVLGRRSRRGPSRSAPGPDLHIARAAVLLPPAPGEALELPRCSGRRTTAPDPLSRALTAVIGHALPADRTGTWGLVAAVPALPGEAESAWQRSVERGAASGRSFSRLVRNSATGAACLAHDLTGPGLTLASGAGTGLLAFVAAVDLMARSPSPAGLVVAAADEVGDLRQELDRLTPERCAPRTAAAAAVVLATAGPVAVQGVGLAGPAHLDRAIAACGAGRPEVVVLATDCSDGARTHLAGQLRGAGLGGLPVRDLGQDHGQAEASGSLLALAHAVERVESGRHERVLVLAAEPSSFAVAVLLGRAGR